MSRYRVIGELDYVQGHLRYGHLALEIDKDKWDSMSEDDQKKYLNECGKLIVGDYEVDGYGDIDSIIIEEL